MESKTAAVLGPVYDGDVQGDANTHVDADADACAGAIEYLLAALAGLRVVLMEAHVHLPTEDAYTNVDDRQRPTG